jgi:Flp pilus assembly protein CpaB
MTAHRLLILLIALTITAGQLVVVMIDTAAAQQSIETSQSGA